MKSSLIGGSVALFAFLIFYLLGAFVQLSFSVVQWTEGARAFVGIMGGTIAIMAGTIAGVVHHENSKQDY